MNALLESVRRAARRMILPALRVGNMDRLSVHWRLRDLRVAHAEVSGLFSQHDSPGHPNDRLLDLSTRFITRSRSISLPLLKERQAPSQVHVWPGENYRLLAAAVDLLRPRIVIEVGTYTGLGALAMLPVLPDGGRLYTYDILPWDRFEGSVLRPEDLTSGRLLPQVGDWSDPSYARAHQDLLSSADLIYLDGPKDGVTEKRILENFETCGVKPGTLIILDDVRVWNMLDIWRGIRHPKLDLVTFGHWTGTGLIDWKGSPPDTDPPRNTNG